MLYFAYGSNMWPEQMIDRCPDARPGHRGRLEGWRFLINERGVATIIPETTGAVWGGLWHVGAGDVVALDRYEGIHEGRYERRVVWVRVDGRGTEPAIVYVDHRTRPGPPRPGYLDKVIAGSSHFRLPEHYVRTAIAPFAVDHPSGVSSPAQDGETMLARRTSASAEATASDAAGVRWTPSV